MQPEQLRLQSTNTLKGFIHKYPSATQVHVQFPAKKSATAIILPNKFTEIYNLYRATAILV